jgi:hypothetical protein
MILSVPSFQKHVFERVTKHLLLTQLVFCQLNHNTKQQNHGSGDTGT